MRIALRATGTHQGLFGNLFPMGSAYFMKLFFLRLMLGASVLDRALSFHTPSPMATTLVQINNVNQITTQNDSPQSLPSKNTNYFASGAGASSNDDVMISPDYTLTYVVALSGLVILSRDPCKLLAQDLLCAD
jgi:hypothetical protein